MFLEYLIFSFLIGSIVNVRWYLIYIYSHGGVENIFMCLLSLWTSSLEKCLVKWVCT
jgi:hypothetical protein